MKPESDLKEKTSHGDVLFPLQQYSTILSPVNPEVSMHWHPEMEVTRITRGQARYSIDLQECLAEEGDFICVQPGLLHMVRLLSPGAFASDSFVFHLNLLGSSSGDICTLRYFAPLMNGTLQLPHRISASDPWGPDISAIFQSLSQAYKERYPGYELEIKSLLFRLLRLLTTHPKAVLTEEADEAKCSQRQRLKKVFDFIHGHFSEEIRIELLARLCHISPSRFMHLFKEATGFTLNQYLNQYRLRQSAILLGQGSDIAEAAYSCGFNHLPYFYKRFQEYYHMTPRQFQLLPETQQLSEGCRKSPRQIRTHIL